MNEPLNTSARQDTFTGKTHNLHPLWYNEPLRLTTEQAENPNLVLTDFFQSYHLHNVREIMWQWLKAMLSSPRDSANDPHERNNYIFFYEKMESLVEAAWVMNRGTDPNGKLPRQPIEKGEKEQHRVTRSAPQPVRHSKPVRLIEKASSEPQEVIQEVFREIDTRELHEYLLPTWLRVAVINAHSPYSNGDGRAILYEFYEQLLPFVEALFELSKTQADYISTSLDVHQSVDPAAVITAFFQQFPIEYIRRELADFLDAGIGYEGAYPNGFSPWQAWMTYNHLLCLTEAAYQLYINQQVETVSTILFSTTYGIN